MTQAVGLALLNQALGWPPIVGRAPASASTSTVSSPTDTTKSSVLAPGLIDLGVPKSAPLGAASGVPASTLVSSLVATLSPAPVSELTPTRAADLAPPNLELPAVDVGDTGRAASDGGSAATHSTGVVLPAPVPEPNGFLVLGLAAAGYALRRRS